MPEFKDLTGQVFGRYTVLYQRKYKSPTMWVCKCACGKVRDVRSCHLLSGNSKSCGCLLRELTSKRNTRYANDTQRKLARVLVGMKSRCHNPKDDHYNDYGGRGIQVHKAWIDDPHVFIEWALLNGWAPELSIDRIDFNGNYEPENCRWSTKKVQSGNRRSCKRGIVFGEDIIASDAAKKYNISPGMLYKKLNDMELEEAVLFLLDRKGEKPEEILTFGDFQKVKDLTVEQLYNKIIRYEEVLNFYSSFPSEIGERARAALKVE